MRTVLQKNQQFLLRDKRKTNKPQISTWFVYQDNKEREKNGNKETKANHAPDP